jgi:hypothetical protein
MVRPYRLQGAAHAETILCYQQTPIEPSFPLV